MLGKKVEVMHKHVGVSKASDYHGHKHQLPCLIRGLICRPIVGGPDFPLLGQWIKGVVWSPHNLGWMGSTFPIPTGNTPLMLGSVVVSVELRSDTYLSSTVMDVLSGITGGADAPGCSIIMDVLSGFALSLDFPLTTLTGLGVMLQVLVGIQLFLPRFGLLCW